MPQTGQAPQAISSPSYIIQVTGVQVAQFSELGGINSEVEDVEYISSDPSAKISHQRLYGKIKPPTVTLKRGFDNSLYMWAWHLRVRKGDPGARSQDATLQICGADRKPQVSFVLVGAWPKKVDITSATAGQGMVYEQVTLVCDEIQGTAVG